MDSVEEIRMFSFMCLRYLEYMGFINSIDRSMMGLHCLRIAMKCNLCRAKGGKLGLDIQIPWCLRLFKAVCLGLVELYEEWMVGDRPICANNNRSTCCQSSRTGRRDWDTDSPDGVLAVGAAFSNPIPARAAKLLS